MNKPLLIAIVIIAVIGIGAALYFTVLQPSDTDLAADLPYGTNTKTPDTNSKSLPLADDRFGFLIGPGPDEYMMARELLAGWVRPHPGAFVWGSMQDGATAGIDFTATDAEVAAAQSAGVKILATLWPYAGWDQQSYDNPSDCKVASEEFTQEFGWYRCAPYDYVAYTNWVEAVVERYDGDGSADMPGLTQPIMYWEVMNEPDLAPPDGEVGLEFFKGTPADYAKLLEETSVAIRTADPNAQILIAGAAGDGGFLDFYREVFADPEVAGTFDIANVHCISSGSVDSFNVVPYAAMLSEFNIEKPVWVTEAEAFVSGDLNIIADQLKMSTENAFVAGAEKIFYTSMDLGRQPGGNKDKDKDVSAASGEDTRQISADIYTQMFKSL